MHAELTELKHVSLSTHERDPDLIQRLRFAHELYISPPNLLAIVVLNTSPFVLLEIYNTMIHHHLAPVFFSCMIHIVTIL